MNKIKKTFKLAERIGYITGFIIATTLWSIQSQAHTNTAISDLQAVSHLTPSMILAALIGAIGSYLAFGEDKKIPPSAASIGHVLLGFGAGLFFTRGSLELAGKMNSSHDIVLFTSFLWAVCGYFLLRLFVSVAKSDKIQQILPEWIAKTLGINKEE